MRWFADSQITIGSTAPTSKVGPALAALGNRLYLAYAGTNGYIYWAWTDNQSTLFDDWQGNEKVTWEDSIQLETLISPALVVLNGTLVMISIDTLYRAVRCSYFDGNQWHGYMLTSLLPPGSSFFSLSAFVAAGQIHLFVYDINANSIHLVCTELVTEFSSWASVGTNLGEFTQSLGLLGSVLYRLGVKYPSEIPFFANYELDPVTGHYQTQEAQTGVLEVADGSARLKYANILYADGVYFAIYLGPSDVTLYEAVFKVVVNGNLLLNPSLPIKVGSDTLAVKSDSPPSLVIPFPVAYGGVTYPGFCMAHKGNDNTKLYLTWGW
jgi:hypothetical protein